MASFEHLLVQQIPGHPGVVEMRLNRPQKRNAMHEPLWREIGRAFTDVLPYEPECRCVLLTGAGPVFSAGIDLASGMLEGNDEPTQGKQDVARKALGVLREGGAWQRAWKAVNEFERPVIACIHSGCYGAALELVAFADVRMCTADTKFRAPEVDLGLAADIGGNQMLPKVLGNDSLVRELQLSGRILEAPEALRAGLVSQVYGTHDELMMKATELAATIASKSPLAVAGTKQMLNFTRDHGVDDSLRFGLTWNAAMIQSNDMKESAMAFASKGTHKPAFAPAVWRDASDAHSHKKARL